MPDDAPGTPAAGERSSPDFDTMSPDEVMGYIEEALMHLSAEQLTRVIQLAQEQRTSKQDEARETLLSEFRQRAAEMGMNLETLFPSGRGSGRRTRSDAGQPLPVKYRGPDGQEWSGRGHPPKWLVALESDGRNREEFRV